MCWIINNLNFTGLLPQRAMVGIMALFACFVSYMLRVNMSINIIAMVVPHSASSGKVAECLRLNPMNTTNATESHDKLIEVEDVSIPSYMNRLKN